MSSVRRMGTGPSLFREAETPTPRSGGRLLWIVLAILLAFVLAVPALR